MADGTARINVIETMPNTRNEPRPPFITRNRPTDTPTTSVSIANA